MIKSELIQQLADSHPTLTHNEAGRVVDIIFEEIIHALETGGRVEIRGFGTFTSRARRGRLGRNPRTGEDVMVTPKHVPFYKVGKGLLDRLNK